MKKLLKCLWVVLCVSPLFAFAQTPAGDWYSYYDNGKPNAKIQVALDANNVLSATVLETYSESGAADARVCAACPDNFNNKPLKGLQILWDLKPESGKWVNGQGLSPERKAIFAATAWLSGDGNTFFVQGKSGLFSKTQEWQRVSVE